MSRLKFHFKFFFCLALLTISARSEGLESLARIKPEALSGHHGGLFFSPNQRPTQFIANPSSESPSLIQLTQSSGDEGAPHANLPPQADLAPYPIQQHLNSESKEFNHTDSIGATTSNFPNQHEIADKDSIPKDSDKPERQINTKLINQAPVPSSPDKLAAQTANNFNWPPNVALNQPSETKGPAADLGIVVSSEIPEIVISEQQQNFNSPPTISKANSVLVKLSHIEASSSDPEWPRPTSTLDNSIGVNRIASNDSNLQQQVGPSSINFSQLTDLSNHVLYDSQGNSSSPEGGYFFSSSEKLPNREDKASNAWWALAFGQHLEVVNLLNRDDFVDYCTRSDLLVSGKQRALCRTHPKVMQIVARGLKMAIDECQIRFSTSRWNCSLALQDSLPDSTTPVFGEIMRRPNRERSFLNAIVAAGLAHAMTKACSQGELPGECSCDKRIRSRNSRGKIEWIGCSDDIDFGSKFSRDFTDNPDILETDSSSMIDAHNYEVGRRVFKSTTDITCICQDGENGLCATKRCWRHLGTFSDIGDELMKRYESATHVQTSNKDPHKLRPVKRGVRKPKRKDLVFIEESPDYCQPDSRLGLLGTHNRRCNSTSYGPDACSSLCCGRGYQLVMEELEEDCNCKFIYCCSLKCEKCKKYVTHDVCN